MPIVPIQSLADDRLWPYRDLKDRDLRQKDGRFIAEGRHVVERLLARPRFVTESLLCIPRVAEELAASAPSDQLATVPIYTLERGAIEDVIGFKFHQGCLAVGRAPEMPTTRQWLADLGDRPATLVVCDGLNNTENLGVIVRICAGFGSEGCLIGPRSADPYFRQAVRVSMGTVFSVPMVGSDGVVADLGLLRSAGFETIATVLRPDAEPLPSVRPADRQVIVLGSEAHGLEDAVIDACSRKVMIPMHLGTDSLNVSIAAAVFLYALTNRSRP